VSNDPEHPERIVRTISTDDELRDYFDSVTVAFLAKRETTDESLEWARRHYDLDRTWAAFDGDKLCGSARTFPSRVRLPGGGDLPVSCLTQVTVLPTHTRRGHLTRLMRAHLEAAIEAGEAASLLIAAEWKIYGRFGYGPYSWWTEWHVDSDRAQVVGDPVGSCELATKEDYDKAAEVVLGGAQATNPGCIERDEKRRQMIDGVDASPYHEQDKTMVWVVHRDDAGDPDGILQYTVKERWNGMQPASTVEVQDLVYLSPDAERELWRYLVDVDLVAKVEVGTNEASIVRHALADGRDVKAVGHWDHIWARILDVPAALTGRSYLAADRLVLEVVDTFMDRGGRFVLDAGPDGATCEPTTDAADLTLPISDLGAAWMGGTDLHTLAVAGTITEHTEGATDRLAKLLSWHQQPWCHTNF
jgi:predicted acetyltransferase